MPKAKLPPEEISLFAGIKDNPSSRQTLAAIAERNRKMESSEQGIKVSYQTLRIKNLRSVPEEEFHLYKKHLDSGSLYIIVHPAYYPFFDSERMSAKNEALPEKNVVERLLALLPLTPRMAVLQAQERRTRDFLEYKSTEEKLIILIVPREHKTAPTYAYLTGPDEYTRYLNEVTNGSQSVLYLESLSATKGRLRVDDMAVLKDFIADVNPERVLVGGGYVGRCLEKFYVHFTENFGEKGVYVVPELSDISPAELKGAFALKLLNRDGSLNAQAASEAMKKNIYNIQEISPQLLNLDETSQN